jgi:transposase
MWTPITRRHYSRTDLRYASDLTDVEWALLEPLLPPPCDQGRPRSWPMREVVNAIFYIMRSGCPWRLLPSDFPPWRTVYRWFAAWRDDGLFERVNHALVLADRERSGREASPTAAVIDSQSVKTSESGGPRGYDAAKKVTGRKRHALVDTDGRALLLVPHPASIQDRDGAGCEDLNLQRFRTLLNRRKPLVSRNGIRVEEEQHPTHCGGNLLQELHPFRSDGVFEMNEAGDPAARPIQGVNKPLTIGI